MYVKIQVHNLILVFLRLIKLPENRFEMSFDSLKTVGFFVTSFSSRPSYFLFTAHIERNVQARKSQNFNGHEILYVKVDIN